MRIHNHRMAMNTRLANRFGFTKAKAGPINPSPLVAIGDPYDDVYSFTAESEWTYIFIADRWEVIGAYTPRRILVEGEGLISSKETPSNDINLKGTASSKLLIINAEVGSTITMTMPPEPTTPANPKKYLRKWTMVQAFAAVDNRPNKPNAPHYRDYAASSKLGVGNMTWTGQFMLSTGGTARTGQEVLAFYVHTSLVRGKWRLYDDNPTPLLDATELYSDVGIDETDDYLSPANPEQSGGYYGMWRYKRIEHTRAVRYGQQINIEGRTDYWGGMSYCLVEFRELVQTHQLKVHKTGDVEPKPNLLWSTDDMTNWAKDGEVVTEKLADGWMSAEYTGEGTAWLTSGDTVTCEVGKTYTFSIEVKAGTLDTTLVQFATGTDYTGEGNPNVSVRKVGGTSDTATFSEAGPGGIEFDNLEADKSIIVAITREIKTPADGENFVKANVTLRPGIWSQLRGTVLFRHPKIEEGSAYTGYVAGQ